jgi:hypothetical protein
MPFMSLSYMSLMVTRVIHDHFMSFMCRAGQRGMAERLVPLLTTQMAQVRFPVPSMPTFRVEKVSLFCYPASGGTFSSTAIEIIQWVKFFAVAQATS